MNLQTRPDEKTYGAYHGDFILCNISQTRSNSSCHNIWMRRTCLFTESICHTLFGVKIGVSNDFGSCDIATILRRRCSWCTCKTVFHCPLPSRDGLCRKSAVYRREHNWILLQYAGVSIYGRCGQSSWCSRRSRNCGYLWSVHTLEISLADDVSSYDEILHTVRLMPQRFAWLLIMNGPQSLLAEIYPADGRSKEARSINVKFFDIRTARSDYWTKLSSVISPC